LPVPDLFGLTYLEAKLVMELNGITPGVILLDEGLVDTSLGFVYWQNPLPFDEAQQTNTIRPGQLMDLRISTVKPENRQDTVLIR